MKQATIQHILVRPEDDRICLDIYTVASIRKLDTKQEDLTVDDRAGCVSMDHKIAREVAELMLAGLPVQEVQ